jgi:membrane protein
MCFGVRQPGTSGLMTDSSETRLRDEVALDHGDRGGDLSARDVRAADVARPAGMAPRLWWRVLARAWKESSRDQAPLMAAGVAFFAFLSIFPGLVAALMIYGLVTDPEQVVGQLTQVTAGLPAAARELLTSQLQTLTASSPRTLGIGLVVSLALALWSASAGIGNLMTAVNVAFDLQEDRGFVRRKILALALTVGAIVAFAVLLFLLAVVPAASSTVEFPLVVRIALQAARWLLVLLLLDVCLAVLYRVAPDRDSPARTRWASGGAGVAIVLWVAACVGFSVYVERFSTYAQTYGALAGVVVLLLWLWLTFYAVLLGAEVNAEFEQRLT